MGTHLLAPFHIRTSLPIELASYKSESLGFHAYELRIELAGTPIRHNYYYPTYQSKESYGTSASASPLTGDSNTSSSTRNTHHVAKMASSFLQLRFLTLFRSTPFVITDFHLSTKNLLRFAFVLADLHSSWLSLNEVQPQKTKRQY